MPGDHSLIPPHGGYRKLRSFQVAQLVYYATVVFCERFVDKRSRTHDQMAQAVRGKYRSDPSGRSDSSDPYGISTTSAEVAANTLICLINQASYLLGRQLRNLEEVFLAEGGFTERLYRERRNRRDRSGM